MIQQKEVQGLVSSLSAKLIGTAASDAETQISATVTEDNKFVSRLKLFNWLVWRLTQAWVFTGKVTVAVFRFNSTTNASPAIGDVYSNGTSLKYMTNQSVVTDLLTKDGNQAFIGGTTRISEFNANGDIIAPNDVGDGVITDTDISSVMTAATYNSANGFTATVVPLNGKIATQGLVYSFSGYFYYLIANNTVVRWPLG